MNFGAWEDEELIQVSVYRIVSILSPPPYETLEVNINETRKDKAIKIQPNDSSGRHLFKFNILKYVSILVIASYGF